MFIYLSIYLSKVCFKIDLVSILKRTLPGLNLVFLLDLSIYQSIYLSSFHFIYRSIYQQWNRFVFFSLLWTNCSIMHLYLVNISSKLKTKYILRAAIWSKCFFLYHLLLQSLMDSSFKLLSTCVLFLICNFLHHLHQSTYPPSPPISPRISKTTNSTIIYLYFVS